MSPRRPAKQTRRRRQANPLVITAAVVIVLVFVVFYAFNQGLPFVSQYTMYAMVNNSVNVRSESPVRIAGINVGTVQGTTPEGRMTKITFTMQGNGLPIHTDATITIRDRLFLEGGYYLQLDPGTPDAPLAHAGFTIESQNTSSPVQFYKVLSTFTAPSRTSLANILNTFNQGFSPRSGAAESDSGAGGLKQAIPPLTPVLTDAALVSQSFTGSHAGDVSRLLTKGSDVASTLNTNGVNLNRLISGLNQTTEALDATDTALTATITGIDQTLRVAPPALTALDRSLPPVDRLARTLTPSLRVAPPLIDRVSSTVSQITRIVGPTERGPLIRTLHTTFTTLPHVLGQLGSVFPVTKGVTDCLSRNAIPVLNSEVQDGSLSTGVPVWKDFVHFLPNVAGATGDFDADGHYTRVLLGAGTNSVTGGLLDTVTSTLNGVTSTLGGVTSTLSGATGGATSGVSSVVSGVTNSTAVQGLLPSSDPSDTITGAAPQWVGTLTAADFRPDVSCTSQAVPNLTPTATGSTVAAVADVRRLHSPGPSLSASAIANDLARAEGRN